jgi:integrase
LHGFSPLLVALQLKKILIACPAWFRPIVQVAASTGMRRGEIVHLRVQDVDIARGLAWLRTTKNGESRGVRLNATALAALEPLTRSCTTDALFAGVSPTNVTVAFKRAAVRAGIQDFTFTICATLRRLGLR